MLDFSVTEMCVKPPTTVVHSNISFLVDSRFVFVLSCFICEYKVRIIMCLVNLSFHHHSFFSFFFFFGLRSVLSDITITTLAFFGLIFVHNILFLKMCPFSHLYFQSYFLMFCRYLLSSIYFLL